MKIIKNLTKNNLEEIKRILQNKGIIIFPTDTVYGIGCDCFQEEAIQKIFNIKKRNNNNPLCVLTDSVEKINKVTKSIKPKEKDLMEKYFPGDLTIIMDKNETVPAILTANLDTIGVRIPNHKIALEILKHYPNPIATTSVNIAGNSPGIEVADFLEEFGEKVDLIIDGGKTPIGLPSTIVKVEDNSLKIIREGHLKVE